MKKIKREDYLFIRWCSGLLGVFFVLWAIYSLFAGGLMLFSQFIYSFWLFYLGSVLLLLIGLNVRMPFSGMGYWDFYEIEK